MTAVMSFIVSTSLFRSWSTSLDCDVLLDAEDNRVITAGLAVVPVADDEVGAVDVGDGEIYTRVLEGIRVPKLEIVTAATGPGLRVREQNVLLEVAAPHADLVVRSLLRRDRDRREVVILRIAETVPLADRDV